MEKILKKYTSIPQHLYVERDADRQLSRIVDEMQRPGYVLVARQMGKTNLLFNAKRTLENPNRLFVYVDLSNVFQYERDCYRNIIDTIIEPNYELFEDIENDIIELRKKELPPHKEYSNSLRIILKSFSGNIVIILDEIDALRSAVYSDNIFAQIRSNYFSRTNFPVFERLTYILSGVIEPTELIKDRNKSPFNIGDKIYLEDFTKIEHNDFINKSKLNISDKISDRIYYWTNGNPRLTFDICSTIEDFIIENKIISEESLDRIVKEKYLTTFDISPIDHIRELVKSNKKVRKSVLDIHQKNSNLLSDEIKNKLYLYGIISSNFDDNIYVKNPIIEKSLSKDWIKSIDLQTQDNYTYGLEKVDQGEYIEAIIALEEFINNSNPLKKQLEICNYYLGFCNYHLRKLDNAIKYFSKEFKLDLYKKNALSLLGICKIGIGEKEEGVKILETVIKSKSSDYAYRSALLNLAPIVAQDEKNRALKLYDDLYESTFNYEDDVKEEELNKTRTLSQYYKAEIFYEEDNLGETLKNLENALKYSTQSDSINLLYSIHNISEKKDKKIKTDVYNLIVEEKIKFDALSPYPISFSERHLYNYIDWFFDDFEVEKIEKLLDYSHNTLFNREINKYEILHNVTFFDCTNREKILKYLVDLKNILSSSLTLNVLKDLTSLKSNKIGKEFYSYFNEYKSLFLLQDKIDKDDLYLFTLVIKNFSDNNRVEESLKLCNDIESKIINIEDDELKFESVIIYYWEAILYLRINDKINSIRKAKHTLELVKDSKKNSTSMIDEKGLEAMKKSMNQIINSSSTNTPIKRERKYGRNERIKVKYRKGGLIKEGKYKSFVADILSERCEIIE